MLAKLGSRLSINETSAFGLFATIGTAVPTYEMMNDMDRKGVVLNAAFSVSASFAVVDHLAFSVSFNEAYIMPMITAKLISGVAAVVFANILYNVRAKKA